MSTLFTSNMLQFGAIRQDNLLNLKSNCLEPASIQFPAAMHSQIFVVFFI